MGLAPEDLWAVLRMALAVCLGLVGYATLAWLKTLLTKLIRRILA